MKEMIASRHKLQSTIRRLIMEEKVEANVSNITLALSGAVPPCLITEEVVDYCRSIIQNSKDFILPKPFSSDLELFSKTIGPNYTNAKHKTPGCYILYDTDLPGSYVGQSVVLGRRVRSHAAGKEKSTSVMLTNFGKGASVRIYAVYKVPDGMSLKMFLLILEQFLFFVIRPTCNKYLIASSGFYNKEGDTSNHLESVGKPLFVYSLVKGQYYLLHTFPSTSAICHLMGISPGWAEDIIRYHSGQYQVILFLSKTPIYSTNNIISKDLLFQFILWLKHEDINRGSPVRITDIQKDSSCTYRSIIFAAKQLEVTWTIIKKAITDNNTVLGRYTIQSITKEEYLHSKLPHFIKAILNKNNLYKR